MEGVTRTYAPRVAGTTISQKYDPKTKKFTLIYDICTVCGHTSIFVSKKYIYKKGNDVDIQDIYSKCSQKEASRCSSKDSIMSN